MLLSWKKLAKDQATSNLPFIEFRVSESSVSPSVMCWFPDILSFATELKYFTYFSGSQME
jgi:hypothetical protein